MPDVGPDVLLSHERDVRHVSPASSSTGPRIALRPHSDHSRLLCLTAVVCLSLPAPVLAAAFAAERGAPQDQRESTVPGEAGVGRPSGAGTAAPPLALTEEESELPVDGKKTAATPTSVPPVIDGDLGDDVWALADVVTDFLQRDPVEGAPASERTEVRVLYDETAIYLAFVLYDSEPDRIIASDLRRDSRLATDDTIAVLFDTFHDHRNGFLFRVNPLGTKYDATVKDERDINSDWDEIWEGAARITADGWQAEMAIPWTALRYQTGSHVWGVDFKREIRRKNEEVAWSNYRRGFDFRAVSQMGHLVGLRDLRLTDRFRLKPYVSGGYTALNAVDVPLSEGDGSVGIEDFKIQLTPNLTADLTYNTDFAQVESDEERVNLSRFPLFFSERREFFLEGADKFSFGGGDGGGGGGGPLATLFHSRNIGLFDGSPVPMTYGAKVAGKLGNTSIGVINAQTGDAPELGHLGSNYSVMRVKQDVLGRSSIGAIFTNAQGGDTYNRVGGMDASFRFFDHFNVGGHLARSHDSSLGSDWIGSFGGGWNGDLFQANAGVDYIGENFDTDLGFLRRRNVIAHDYSVGFNPRPATRWIRQIRTSASVDYVTDTAGRILDRAQRLWTRVQLESGDGLSISVSREFERLEEGFEVSERVAVAPGDYRSTDWSVSLESYRARPLSGRIHIGGGGFYGGSRRSMGLGGTVRLNEKVSLSPGYSFNRIDLPGGAFDTHVATMRGAFSFSDRVLTSALVQYNSVAERLSVFARLNYIYRTGDDVFLVFKSTTLYDPEFYGQTDSAIIAKMTRSFEF